MIFLPITSLHDVPGIIRCHVGCLLRQCWEHLVLSLSVFLDWQWINGLMIYIYIHLHMYMYLHIGICVCIYIYFYLYVYVYVVWIHTCGIWYVIIYLPLDWRPQWLVNVHGSYESRCIYQSWCPRWYHPYGFIQGVYPPVFLAIAIEHGPFIIDSPSLKWTFSKFMLVF